MGRWFQACLFLCLFSCLFSWMNWYPASTQPFSLGAMWMLTFAVSLSLVFLAASWAALYRIFPPIRVWVVVVLALQSLRCPENMLSVFVEADVRGDDGGVVVLLGMDVLLRSETVDFRVPAEGCCGLQAGCPGLAEPLSGGFGHFPSFGARLAAS